MAVAEAQICENPAVKGIHMDTYSSNTAQVQLSPAAVPARQGSKPASLSVLPFVYRPKRGFKSASNWRVPAADSYALACETGRRYAAHFVQYMKDNPCMVGSNVLGSIAADIDFKNETGAKGYWVGFFSQLERLIFAQAQRMDVFADVDRVNAYYAEILAKRDLEAREE